MNLIDLKVQFDKRNANFSSRNYYCTTLGTQLQQLFFFKLIIGSIFLEVGHIYPMFDFKKIIKVV
jgi:hypothetical protein